MATTDPVPRIPRGIDLSTCSFEEWLDFVFDHPVPPAGEDPWYQADELHELWDWGMWESSRPRLFEYSTRLFNEPEVLPDRYSTEQIDQGLWFFLVASPMGFSAWIWSPKLPLEVRARCVRGMYHVFERLYSQTPEIEFCFMWWDVLRDTKWPDDDQAIRPVMVETIARILRLPSEDCQYAALHGLNHFHDSYTSGLIRQWLSEHPEISDDLRTYANYASRGQLM